MCHVLHEKFPMTLRVSYHSYKAKTQGRARAMMYRNRCPHHYTKEDSSYFSEDGYYALGLSLNTLKSVSVKDLTKWM